MIKILKNNLLLLIVLVGTLVSVFSVYALQSNDPPPFNSKASSGNQVCVDLNSVKDCYFSLRINDDNNYQAYLGEVDTIVYDIQDPSGPSDGSEIKIEMCLDNGGSFGSGIACNTIVGGQYLVGPTTFDGPLEVDINNLQPASFASIHIRIKKAGSSSVLFGSGRRVHIDSITVPTNGVLQGEPFQVSWDSTNSTRGNFYFGGPISCDVSNGGSVDDVGSTNCTGTGAGTAQVEVQQYGPVGGGADYVSDIRTIQINPVTTVTPLPTTPGQVNLNFQVFDPCTNPKNPVPGASVTIDQNFGNGTNRTTDGLGFANFGVSPNTSIGWSVVASGFSDSVGNINSGNIGTTVKVALTRNCSSPTPTSNPTSTPLPGAPFCSISFSPSNGNQGSPLSIVVGLQNDADNLMDFNCGTGSLGSGQLPAGQYNTSFPADSQSCAGTARNSSGQTGSCSGSFTVNGSPVTPTPTPTPSVPPGSVSDSCSVIVQTPEPQITTLRVRANVGSGNWTIAPTPTTGGSNGTGSNYISYTVVPGTAYVVTPGWISSGYNQPGNIYVTPLSAGETRSVDINYVVTPPPSVSNISITEPNYCISGPAVTVGWAYSDPAGSPQSAYQVQISNTGNFNSPVLDTGKVNSGSSSYFTGQGILQFNTTYRARVKVWNGYGVASDWSSTSNSWKTPPYAYPQVDFNWTANGILNNPSPPVNNPVTFTDQTVFNGNPNGRKWSWTFGDGGSSLIQNPSHTYTTEGSYYVTLTATDNSNQSCARTKGPLIIQKPIPKWREIAPR